LPELTPLTIAIWDDPILSTVCAPVGDDEFGEGLETLGKQMLLTMRNGNGIGLAASQVGLAKRLFVMKRQVGEHKGDEIIAVNPAVTTYGEFQAHAEGCLSFPGIYGLVSRRQKCDLSYQNVLTGERERVEGLEGLDAFCAQHEQDHLYGIMFFDKARMPGGIRKKVLKEWEKSRKGKI
jgi:peptide deformylase